MPDELPSPGTVLLNTCKFKDTCDRSGVDCVVGTDQHERRDMHSVAVETCPEGSVTHEGGRESDEGSRVLDFGHDCASV